MNATAVLNHLAVFERGGFVTLEVTRSDVRIHYFDMDATNADVDRVKENIEALVMAEAVIEDVDNEKVGVKTFNVRWDYWKYA